MKDAVSYYSKTSKAKAKVYQDLKLEEGNFVLATIHRQETTDNLDNLKSVFEGLSKINKEKRVIMPLHPRTKNVLEKNNLYYDITFIAPVGYFDMLELLKNCSLVISDSGGLQKEAFFNKKPVIIARTETEWVELVQHGFAKIVAFDKDKMYQAFNYFKDSKLNYAVNLYGDEVGEKMYLEILDLLERRGFKV